MKGNTVQIQVRTTEENRVWLKEIADKQERSVNWVINKIVSDARSAAQVPSDGRQ
jgi:hypothetical protein